jgi:hypothetical protein
MKSFTESFAAIAGVTLLFFFFFFFLSFFPSYLLAPTLYILKRKLQARLFVEWKTIIPTTSTTDYVRSYTVTTSPEEHVGLQYNRKPLPPPWYSREREEKKNVNEESDFIRYRDLAKFETFTESGSRKMCHRIRYFWLDAALCRLSRSSLEDGTLLTAKGAKA